MPNIIFYGFHIEMYMLKYIYGYCTCFFVFSEPRNMPQRGKAADAHATWAKQTIIMHVGTGNPELTIDQQTNQKVPKVPPTSDRHNS